MCELHQQSVDDDDSDINTKGNSNTQYNTQYIHKYLSTHTLMQINFYAIWIHWIQANIHAYTHTHTHIQNLTNKYRTKKEYNQMLSMLSHAFTVTNTNALIN